DSGHDVFESEYHRAEGRPLNRQALSREVRRESSGLGHSAVTAAVIAATSASLAVGRTERT
ncbi:MAG: hypothetical protein ACO3ER_05075, partial [Ilumatobacteraceae bacterium]